MSSALGDETSSTPAPHPARNARYRRPLTWIVAGAGLVGLFLGLLFGVVLAGSADTAEGILARDGFPVTQRLDKAQLATVAGGNANAATDRMMASYLESAVAGVKGSKEEVVVLLNPAGQAAFSALLPLLQAQSDQGVTVRMQGPYLIFQGPAGRFTSGPSSSGLTPGASPTSPLCLSQTAPVVGGAYIVQNNEWGSSAPECITTDGNTGFTVAGSSISNDTIDGPGGYPSIYQGCHWGNCTAGGLGAHPIRVSDLTVGKVTTSWSTTQPAIDSAYDASYDIWFNQTPTTVEAPNGAELMIWLSHRGIQPQPAGFVAASNVRLGGHTYDIWIGTGRTWKIVTYEMTSPATAVQNLDIGMFSQDMVHRGYAKRSWYLIDVEAGFEIWQGGAGLQANSFSVTINH